MAEYVVESKNLTKYYQDFCALNQVDISVKRGEIYGLVGDNGAGKTTFLKLLAGQIFPGGGEIKLFGKHEPKELDAMRSRMGVIIENPGFYPQLSVEKNLEYYRIQKGIPGRNSMEEALEITGLKDARKKACKNLSLGMKQRLGLAIALMGVPELLLLDEPINGLDPSGIIEMRNLLLRLNQEKNITILISSHILSELEHIATMYGFLRKGQLLEQVSAEQIRKKCSDYVEILVSDAERYTVALEQKMGHTDYKILPDKKIHIYNTKESIEVYSRLAAEAGLEVMALSKCQQTLEEYYMKLNTDEHAVKQNANGCITTKSGRKEATEQIPNGRFTDGGEK
ncbi:MAG: ABC transporter ATP-binding protein [Eubacteriales bacterium]|nr:ABC transporter ATP-binding protein [Eubacteriales bacterium]